MNEKKPNQQHLVCVFFFSFSFENIIKKFVSVLIRDLIFLLFFSLNSFSGREIQHKICRNFGFVKFVHSISLHCYCLHCMYTHTHTHLFVYNCGNYHLIEHIFTFDFTKTSEYRNEEAKEAEEEKCYF